VLRLASSAGAAAGIARTPAATAAARKAVVKETMIFESKISLGNDGYGKECS